ncbi:PQQ-binding-like beta-propeller repeat protein [Telmatocola sphagniphila]|uniref:PQQ-binding-like beta-propeller repeat protein n=1 Tax=Telmatocola sphagniphila TaxID=1123043 RepID=A0A8E6EVX5_9BACT|nr:PQQ-binding-like beta-propeller repeat protein [Telmatocola sphagniphila]QVL33355.1 PQQ-binding-like beta-propeller repeat protein [Telmatocola sphagniphila]
MKIAFCSLCIVFLGSSLVYADDWPQWLGPKRDGVWREDGILDKFPAGGPKVLWRQPISAGYSGPAIADGRIYVMDRTLANGVKSPANAFATAELAGKERILCLNEKTGKEIWKYDYDCAYRISYPTGPRCTPTVDGDKVYSLGAMGNLTCQKTENGEVLWKKDFQKEYDAKVPLWGFAAHPLIDGDLLICLAGGSQNRLVVAFDKSTGKEVWTALDCPGDFGYSPPMIYSVAGHRQLIIWHGQKIVGLDPKTGESFWSLNFPLKMALNVPAVRKVDEDKLFITAFYNGAKLLKVAPTGRSVEVVWEGKGKSEMPDKTDTLQSIMPTPAVKDGFIYGVCSYGQLRCLDAKNGARVWESMQATRGRQTPKKVSSQEGPDGSERWDNAFIIEHQSRYFLFNEQGELIIAELSPKGYREIDRAVILEPTNNLARHPVIWVHPAFANKNMYIRNDREIVAVSLAK